MMGNSLGAWEAHQCIKHGNIPRLEEWINSERLNVDLRFRGESLLCTAINQNQPLIVQLLLKHGANPNLKSAEGGRNEPPIITATRLKNLKIVQILLENGADLHCNNFYGDDAIFQAVVENAFGILEYFLNKMIHGSPRQKERIVCPLILSIKHGATYPLKKRCLLLLLRYHYLCQCCICSGPEGFNGIFKLDFLRNCDPDPDVLKWIYLSRGNTIAFRDDYRNQKSLATVLPLKLKLKNLTRVQIRKCISEYSYEKESNFAGDVAKLQLPTALTNFLLLKDVS